MDPFKITFKFKTGEAKSVRCASHGFKIHFPKQTLPDKLSDCTILIRVNPSCQYKLPENAVLVSAIYQISCPVKLTKPVILEIQHCTIIERPEQSSFLTFVRAEDSHQIQFQPIEGGEFSSSSSYAKISLEKFSILAVILYYVTLGCYPIDYYTKVYVTPSPSVTPTQREYEVYCVILRCLSVDLTVSFKLIRNVLLIYKSLLQESQRYCVNKTIYEELKIRFESDEIAFKIEKSNLSERDWKCIPTLSPSTVCKANNNFFVNCYLSLGSQGRC